MKTKCLLRKVQVSWQAARDAWLSCELNDRLHGPEFDLELQIDDLEKLRDVAGEQFGQGSELFRHIDKTVKNGNSEEMEAARKRFIEEAYEYLPPDVAPF